MATYYGRTVDVVTLQGSLDAAMSTAGADAASIVLDSTDCPELGAHVCKMPVGAPGFEAYFVDHGAYCGNHIIFSIRFRALTHPAVSDWGDTWTSAMQIFSAYIDNPYWNNWGGVIDGRCRAKDEAGQNSRVVEFVGVGSALTGTVDVVDHGLYTLCCELTRNPATGVFDCKGQIRAMGTSTVVGEKTWTMSGADPAPIPSWLEFGIRNLGPFVPTPQDVFFSDLVIDTSADGVYPILDYSAGQPVVADPLLDIDAVVSLDGNGGTQSVVGTVQQIPLALIDISVEEGPYFVVGVTEEGSTVSTASPIMLEAIEELSAKVITVSFSYMNGGASIPTVPKTLTWSLRDLNDEVVNGKENVPVSIIGASVSIVVSGEDLNIDGSGELRKLVIRGTYDSELGNDLPFTKEIRFPVLKVSGL